MGKDEKRNQKDESEMTPLERYLAKQKGSGVEPDSRPSSRPEQQPQASAENEPEELRAAPKPPPPTFWSASPSSAPTDAAGTKSEGPTPNLSNIQAPGGFFARFFAYLIDGIIVFSISLPLRGFAAFVLWFFPFGIGDASVGSMSLGSFLSIQVITFFYYGWFYREKGATPGKMVLGLEIRQHPSGERLSYVTSYLRESVGKYLSGLVLLIGYLMVLFRGDRRSLHDLIFSTEVVVKK